MSTTGGSNAVSDAREEERGDESEIGGSGKEVTGVKKRWTKGGYGQGKVGGRTVGLVSAKQVWAFSSSLVGTYVPSIGKALEAPPPTRTRPPTR